MTSTNDIRRGFLEFFARNDHQIVPSSPLVPHNDPTLLFTNAGMVQFKNLFTGAETRPYVRAASSQKCVRAGGKHNDLDNVGYTARHHTFFEMLGNFSFGDYFKDRAIELAWTLLTTEWGLAPNRLIVTVYHDDDEAFDLWRKVSGLPEDRILRIATSDNFWMMGETGPCGPCSEIFFDHGEHLPGAPPGSDAPEGDRFVEIWNLVFMQYDQVDAETRVPLPRPSIDTGMGLERIAAVLQGTHDNFEIDLFRNLIAAAAEASGVPAEGPRRVSYRVIADHLRAAAFLIADGVLPANEGRGYVLRRILRRAMRHVHMLGVDEPLMWRLVPALIREMGEAFPELERARALIAETLKLEEGRFHRTLERGLRLLESELEKLGQGAVLPGEVAFRLYDTYGFPLDLTQDVLRAQGRTVDVDGFNAAMARQRAEARKAWAGSGESATEALWFDIREQVGASEFLGYETLNAEGRIVALVVDGTSVEAAEAPAEVAVVTNQTPFYGESGGQIGDTGELVTASGARLVVTDTKKKLGDVHVHLCRLDSGAVRVGDIVEMQVDGARRRKLRAAHSATHLLHQVLRRRLGEHVVQKGSLVAPDRLRFDISHPRAITQEELDAIEHDVNAAIIDNSEVVTHLMTPDEAIKAGALALFGEKYGDEVRVVAMGPGTDGGEAPFSVELCGGTHVRRTGDIGLFKITAEGAVAAGVRRIEALTGEAALDYVAEEERRLRDAARALKTTPEQVAERAAALIDERRRLERQLSELRRRLAMGGGAGGGEAEARPREVAGIKIIAQCLEGVPPRDLRSLVDAGKKRLDEGVVALVSVVDGKAGLVVGVTDGLTGRINAVDLVRVGAAALGGKGGGGRPDLAQAGGPDGSRAQAALEAIEKALEQAAAAA